MATDPVPTSSAIQERVFGFADTERTATENAMAQRAENIIPGGCHTSAKGRDQYPQRSPAFIERGLGSRVWDSEGREYIEYACGLRSVTLGHAWPSVNEAAKSAIDRGLNFNRPAPLELEAAERFLELIPTADMVKFTKDGSTVMTAAIKLARAWTGRQRIALCSDSPFYSYDDWFIGTTAIAGGTLTSTVSYSSGFRFNDSASLERVCAEYPGEIACVVLEPARSTEPAPGFLQRVRELCDREGAILVFDETITGFRWHRNGAQAEYGVIPDLSCFGKAMANGFSLSALAGKRDLMELGGLRQRDRSRVFLLSTTHGAETPALAAGMETMRVYRDEPVTERLEAAGERLRRGIETAVIERGLQEHVTLMGRGCALLFNIKDDQGASSQALRTLVLQELLRHGVLAPSLMPTYSHTDDDLDLTIAAFTRSLDVLKDALRDGAERYLVGPPSDVVYRDRN